MKCRGNFKIKGLIKKNGGEFTTSQGKIIKYDESYSLKVDEVTENGIYERTFKISVNSPLINQLKDLKPYNDITLEFDVNIYGSNIKIVPVTLVK